ncbi:HIT-like protein [compost metagenome]
MNDVKADDIALIGEVHLAAQEAAKRLGVDESGYRLINNCGTDGEQTVHHLHYHLLGGTRLGALTSLSDSHKS